MKNRFEDRGWARCLVTFLVVLVCWGVPQSRVFPHVPGRCIDSVESKEPGNLSIPVKGIEKVDSGVIAREKKEEKKRRFPYLLVAGGVVVAVIIAVLVLKKKSVVLTVEMDDGVEGTPGAGTHEYRKGDTVEYSYQLKEGHSDLIVQLDGEKVSESGRLTMGKDTTLTVTASPPGSVRVTSEPSGADILLDGTDTGEKTPASLNRVPAGTHEIVLRKNGYLDYSGEVEVRSGQQAGFHGTLQEEFHSGITWIRIPEGYFPMGDNFNEGNPDERPVHSVYLDEYDISRYQITFELYDRFCRDTGRSLPSGEGWGRGDRPVINVSWEDCRDFCIWLSEKTGQDIRLPTEAQWEKAARSDDQRRYPWGNMEPNASLCNYNNNVGRTVPVGSYPEGRSPYGLDDMAGNIWEWCLDRYSPYYYQNSPENNPQGPNIGGRRSLRGGDWFNDESIIRSTYRISREPFSYSNEIGMRVVRIPGGSR